MGGCTLASTLIVRSRARSCIKGPARPVEMAERRLELVISFAEQFVDYPKQSPAETETWSKGVEGKVKAG